MDPITMILSGLSLAKHVPTVIEKVAGLFGKKVPEGVTEVTDFISDVSTAVKKGQLSPEAQVELQKIMLEHEIDLKEWAYKEKQLEFETTKLTYDDVDSQRELEKTWINSEDEFVRRTRPLILRELFNLVVIYTMYAPLCVIAASYVAESTTMGSLIGFLEYSTAFIYSSFLSAFLGYTAARTVDKRKPDLKDQANVVGKAINWVVKK